MNRRPYTPQDALNDAVQANLARTKSLHASEDRKADYYEGMAEAYQHVYAALAGVSAMDAQDEVISALEDLENRAK